MISVVIPLYNKEKSICFAIESVLAQTYPEYELVVVDDGSTDRSAEMVESLLPAGKGKLIRKENGGVSSARNRGILEAKGEHIAFLDADDIWEPTYLEELRNLIDECPDAGIYGVGIGSSLKGIKSSEPNDFPLGYCGYVENPWSLRFGCWTGSSTTILKLAFEKVGMFDERMAYGEDLDMWWRVLLEYKGAFLNQTLAYYIQDSENRAMNRVIPFEKHLPFFIEKYAEWRESNPEFRQFFDRECVYRLYPYATIPKYRKDLKRVLSQIDFSQLKSSMRMRFVFPRLYGLYLKLKDIAS